MRSVALALVLASACGPSSFVRYDLDTEVSEDGIWTRTTTGRGFRREAAAPHASEYQRVSGIECAALPPCSPEAEPPPPPLPTCPPEEVRPIRNTRQFVGGCGATLQRETWRRSGRVNDAIPPDFQRAGTIYESERIAGNVLEITRTDLGLLVFYEYRETYHQWLTPGDVIDAGRIALDIGLDFALEVLHAELGVDYDVTRVEAFLREARGELAEIVAIVAFSDLELDAAQAEMHRRLRIRGVAFDANGEPDEESAGEWFDAHIAPLLVPKREGAPQLTWADLSTEYFQGYLDEKWKARRDALTAQDGPLMALLGTLEDAFAATQFRLTVRLPGRLVDTDGAVGADGAISWRLDPDDFEIEPREIHALSVEMTKRFTNLYPRAEIDGQGLVAISEIARDLSDDERARVAEFLSAKDTASLTAWCGESLPARRLVRLLGLELQCHSAP